MWPMQFAFASQLLFALFVCFAVVVVVVAVVVIVGVCVAVDYLSPHTAASAFGVCDADPVFVDPLPVGSCWLPVASYQLRSA